MFCENCGAKLEDNEKFCTSCGTPVGGSGPVVAPTAAKKMVNLAPVKGMVSKQMSNKKPLAMWQMIAIEVLLGVLLLTMFLPFFRVNLETMDNIKNDLLTDTADVMVNGDGLEQATFASLAGLYKENKKGLPELRHAEEFEESVEESFPEVAGINPNYVSGLTLMFAPNLRDLVTNRNKYKRLWLRESAEEIFKEVSSTFSGLKAPLWTLYLLAILLLAGIPLSRIMKLPRMIPLAATAGFGLLALILTFVVRGHRYPISASVWSEIRTGTTFFMLLIENLIIVVAVLLFLKIFDKKVEKVIPQVTAKITPKNTATQPQQTVAAEPAAASTGGFDPFTGEPIGAAVPPMPTPPSMPEASVQEAVEEVAPPPMPEPPVQEAVEEVAVPPMPEPPTMPEPPAMPEPQETSEDRQVVGYDPFTGEPIYEGSPAAKALVEETAPEPVEEEIAPPPMPEPSAPEPEEEVEEPEEEIEEPEEETPEEPAPEPESTMGVVRAINGVANGQGFRLPETNVIIVGKDSSKATWVIDDELIGDVHCSIRYNSESDQYLVKDTSEKGTFIGSIRLVKDEMTTLPAGTVLSLGDESNQIRLG